MQWVKLGDYIEQCDERNVANCDYPVIGINKDKEFMPTVANTDEIDLKKYKIIRPGQFIFSGMQTGRDVCIRIGLYYGEPALISPAYTTFVITKPDVLLPEFVFMYFKRTEMDRYGWFISDYSVRSNLDWPRFLDIEIPLPSIDEQRVVVEAWRGLKNLKEQNEQMAGPLMDLCQSYLQELKHKYPLVEIGGFVEETNERNADETYTEDEVNGVSITKRFIPTRANMDGVSVSNYKCVHPNTFAYKTNTDGLGDDQIAIAFNDTSATKLISSIYTAFKVNRTEVLLSEYLFLWLLQSEFGRYARYNSWGSAREMFGFDALCRYRIPLPPIEVQQAIMEIYNCARTSKYISEAAKKLFSDVCPALIRQIIGDNK